MASEIVKPSGLILTEVNDRLWKWRYSSPTTGDYHGCIEARTGVAGGLVWKVHGVPGNTVLEAATGGYKSPPTWEEAVAIIEDAILYLEGTSRPG